MLESFAFFNFDKNINICTFEKISTPAINLNSGDVLNQAARKIMVNVNKNAVWIDIFL